MLDFEFTPPVGALNLVNIHKYALNRLDPPCFLFDRNKTRPIFSSLIESLIHLVSDEQKYSDNTILGSFQNGSQTKAKLN